MSDERRFARYPGVRGLVLLLIALLSLGSVGASAAIIATVTVSPLVVSLAAPDLVRVDRSYKVKAAVENVGVVELEEATVTLRVPGDMILLSKEPTLDLPKLRPGRTASKSWRLECPEVGTYVLQAEARAIEPEHGTEVTSTASTVVVVVPAWLAP